MMSSIDSGSSCTTEATIARADAAPIAPASSRSAKLISAASACAGARACQPIRRPYDAKISSARALPRNRRRSSRNSSSDALPRQNCGAVAAPENASTKRRLCAVSPTPGRPNSDTPT